MVVSPVEQRWGHDHSLLNHTLIWRTYQTVENWLCVLQWSGIESPEALTARVDIHASADWPDLS